MPAGYTLQNMFADLRQFQAAMAEIHASLRNPEDKARLGELLEQLEEARAQAEENVPAILNKKLRDAQKQQAELEELQKQLSQVQEQLQAKEDEEARKEAEAPPEEAAEAPPPEEAARPGGPPVAAKPGPAVPALPSLPEVPIDALLGQDLRVELLRNYGGLIT
jgi:TolA-binding protein